MRGLFPLPQQESQETMTPLGCGTCGKPTDGTIRVTQTDKGPRLRYSFRPEGVRPQPATAFLCSDDCVALYFAKVRQEQPPEKNPWERGRPDRADKVPKPTRKYMRAKIAAADMTCQCAYMMMGDTIVLRIRTPDGVEHVIDAKIRKHKSKV